MEKSSDKGVLSHLSLLEEQARRCRVQQQPSRVEQLKAKVEALCEQRGQLKAEIHTLQHLQKLRETFGKNGADEEMDDGSENADILQLMARCTRLRDLLHAHYLIGGYDIVKTRQGKGLSITLTTAYEGTYLDTFNLEIDVRPTIRIRRHNIPPFIPLNNLLEGRNKQTDLRNFLDALSQHLNAFSGRKQQLKLVKDQHKSVEVMESNVLCSLLVLLVTVPEGRELVLCTLEYADHSRCLPTGVHFECGDKPPRKFQQWKNNCRILLDNPVHNALGTLRRLGFIL